MAYSLRRFGGPARAAGQSILINNVGFTIVGVAPPEFFGVDPGAAPNVFLPLHTMLLLDPDAAPRFAGPNHYWLEMMGRLRPGITRANAQAVLETPFAQWVASTAVTDRERANLPRLHLAEGAGGLDTLRSQYAQPLYVLWAIVALILAIACANTASLLLARASARTREMAVRISIGAGRFRVVRQLLTESVLLAALSGALGVFIAFAGVRLLTRLLANGREGFTLHAEMNWQVLAVTLGLTLVCGLLFGLAPAVALARPAQMPSLKAAAVTGPRARIRHAFRRPSLTQALVVAQIAISVLLLVAAGLFVRTLTNLESIPLGFNRDHVLLFEVNAPQAGYPEAGVPAFYAELRRTLSALPGVQRATLSHASLIRAGRAYPVTVNGVQARGHRILQAGPDFFTTLEIPLLRGRAIDDRDRQGSVPVAVVSDVFARTYFGDEDPIGQRLQVGGSSPLDAEVVGIASTVRYGGLRQRVPPVVYLSYAQVSSELRQMVFALRTSGDPLRYVSAVRAIVHEADPRVPVTNIKTLAADIDQTINQEIVFARLCTAFAMLALLTACVGLYGTMAHSVARQTRELGIRMALGATRRLVIWMVLREVWMLGALGVLIGVPVALATSRLVESFLYGTKPNDPAALAAAVLTLLAAALAAGYGPARRASRVDPIIALRDE
jgi:predicted permease